MFVNDPFKRNQKKFEEVDKILSKINQLICMYIFSSHEALKHNSVGYFSQKCCVKCA